MAEDTHPVAAAPGRRPEIWVPIVYFAEGLPYTVVNLMSVIFLKDLGASNQLIGVTSLLYLPWVFKGVWSPAVDIRSTKRRWILGMEALCTLLLLLLALGMFSSDAVFFSVAVFAFIAFASATHDIAIDGFYLDALDKDRQAWYVGVRSAAYKLAWLAGSGGLVYLAGYLAARHVVGYNPDGTRIFESVRISLMGSGFTPHPLAFGWSAAFLAAAAIFAMILAFQAWYLPFPAPFTAPRDAAGGRHKFFEAFTTYFTQDRIGWIVAYVLIFRLGDAFMIKMAPPFLMDTHGNGGLAISTEEIGILYGTVGVIFLLLGGLLGGFVIARQGLKRWMWPTALLQNSAIILYWILAMARPGMVWVYLANSFEQFSYGLGVSAYTVFLMQTVRPEYKASHYAITTGFMAAGVLVPGFFSGYLQGWLGYERFFLMSFLVSLPGLVTISFLPLRDKS